MPLRCLDLEREFEIFSKYFVHLIYIFLKDNGALELLTIGFLV